MLAWSTYRFNRKFVTSFSTTNCHFVYCDEDQRQTAINLDVITLQIIKNNTITYHLTLSDAQTETIRFQVLKQPNLHANQAVRAVDAGNGCEKYITIDLVVNPRPIIPVLAPLTNCDQDANNQNGSN
jgi:hypothetical protein